MSAEAAEQGGLVVGGPARAPGEAAGRSSPWRVLGWAAYLACSWTWCIGMFLPVLLVRDYGVWGFVVFAVPNVVGAAAMGWVLRDGASERITAAHGPAARWFSLVTIAFHAFFFPWLVLSGTPYSDDTAGRLLALVGLGCLGVSGVVLATSGRFRPAALVIWLLSVGCGLMILGAESTSVPMGVRPAVDLAFLAPVCVFGFALCPYLDLTFHRAAKEQRDRGRRISFTVGFGLLFLVMILITLAYSGPVGRGIRTAHQVFPQSILFIALLLHIGFQTIFTVAVHHTEMHRSKTPLRGTWMRVGLILVCAALPLVFGTRNLEGGFPPAYHGLQVNEVIYRLFMSFYGLFFPAYVWLCMIPVRGEPHTLAPNHHKLAVLATACLAAAPFYWMGFIERHTIWLAPGLLIVLAARLLIRRPRPAAAASPTPA